MAVRGFHVWCFQHSRVGLAMIGVLQEVGGLVNLLERQVDGRGKLVDGMGERDHEVLL